MNANKTILMLIALVIMCGFTSCDDRDEPEIITEGKDEEVNYYDYSEKGFFMNGESLVKGAFDQDSVITGYAKYVKRTAHYRTKTGEEREIVMGYGLVAELDNYVKFYSDDIKYNTDSTRISCNGELVLLDGSEQVSKASIEALIDTIGKPHLITCRTTLAGKPVTMQFRQTYYNDPYSDLKHPDPDNFDI